MKHILTKATIIGLSGLTVPAYAQEDQAKPERIEVTGSRVKRVDAEGANPLTIIDAEQIEQSGVTSIRDLLSNFSGTSAAFAGGGSSVAGGVATISLKGLGASRTLVLVDGVKLPKHPELAAVDLNSIPIAAVERVEVLKQSAAAVYGTDAVGGVINIITKKEFTDHEVSLQYNYNTKGSGDTATFQATTGFNTDNTSSVIIFSFDDKERIGTADRDHSRERTSSFGSPGVYSANIGGESEAYPVEGCSTYDTSNGSIAPSASCPYNYNSANSLQPEYKRFSLLYNFGWDLSTDSRITAKLLATKQNTKSILRPENTASLTSTVSQDTINAMSDDRFNELFPGFGGTKPTEGGVGIKARLTDFGNAVTEKEADLVGADVKYSSYLNENWELIVGVNASGSKTISKSSNKLREANLESAIAEGNYIPWDSSLDLNAIRNSVLSEAYYTEEIRTAGAEASISGSLGELPGGAIGVAFGVGGYTEDYEIKWNDPVLNEELINVAGAPGKGDREVYFAYAETILPVAEKVEVNLAARFDDYSDFGSSFNPLAGVSYRAFDWMLLRGSAATAFKAPTLDELYSGPGVSFNSVTDYTWCEANGISRDNCRESLPDDQRSVENQRQGNEDLDAETSESYSLGFVLSPGYGLSLTTDYFKVISNDQITFRDLQKVVDDNDPDYVIRDSSGAIERVIYEKQNLSKAVVAGFDLSLRYDQRIGSVRLGFESQGTWYTENKETVEGVEDNLLGTNLVPKWRLGNRLSTAFTGGHIWSVSSSSTGTHEFADGSGRIPQYTVYNSQYKYLAPWKGELAFGVNNIMDSQGGFDPAIDSVDQNLYSIRGREYYVRVSQRF